MIEIFRRCVCDECGNEGPETLESESPEKLAMMAGWSYSDGSHYCPDCTKKKGLE